MFKKAINLYVNSKSGHDVFTRLRLSITFTVNVIMLLMATFFAVEGFFHFGVLGLSAPTVLFIWSGVNLVFLSQSPFTYVFMTSSLLCGLSGILVAAFFYGGGISNTAFIYSLPLILAAFTMLPTKGAILFIIIYETIEIVITALTFNGYFGVYPAAMISNLAVDLTGGKIISASFGMFFHRTLRNFSSEIDQKNRAQNEVYLAREQLSKMSSLGTMAAGIAHEVNNPLAIAQGFIEICIEEEESKQKQKRLEKVLKSLDRIKKVVRTMNSFEPSATSENQDINIERIVEKVITMASQKSDELDVNIVKLFKYNVSIREDQRNLAIILFNILINAVEAAAENAKLNDIKALVTIDLILDEESIVFEIRDNGQGIDSDVESRIFDPFFTTKTESNAGSGLTLSNNLIKSMNGEITYYRDGLLSVFQVRLPIIQGLKLQSNVYQNSVVA